MTAAVAAIPAVAPVIDPRHAPRAVRAPATVDPRRLPILARPARRALINARHVWVLHRKILMRLLAALAVAALAVLVVQARDGIGAVAMTVSDLVQGELANAGFGIDQIAITGQVLTSEAAVAEALAIGDRTSTVNFDAEAARARLLELPAVAEASVRKVYPGRLIVTIEEKTPIARWRIDGVTFLIDATGAQIGDATAADEALPLVIGDGAADDALIMIRALERAPLLSEGLLALSRIADRRWDMIYDNGLRVQLPELGVAQALRRLDEYHRDHALLDRDLVLIDMRVEDTLAVRVAERADEEESAAASRSDGAGAVTPRPAGTAPAATPRASEVAPAAAPRPIGTTPAAAPRSGEAAPVAAPRPMSLPQHRVTR